MSFRIGDILIDPPLSLAPMAGHTNYPFRLLVREQGGCGLVTTELISSRVLHYEKSNRKRTTERFDWDTSREFPFAVQLYGGDPAIMAEAARVVVDHGAAIVDINMGCWVPKVAKSGGGAALLRDIREATAVVEAVVSAVDIPVTVKVRAGWRQGEPTAIDFARAAEALGVAAVTVHGRYADQGFSGAADWSIIARVKHAVSIPVIGNGDLISATDARRMVAETGCDGLMIGRAALGRPWFFQRLDQELRGGTLLPEPSLPERAALALRHAHLYVESTASWQPEAVACLELRGQLMRYDLDLPGSKATRARLIRAGSLAEIDEVLLAIAVGNPV